jgi:hypothetical protein
VSIDLLIIPYGLAMAALGILLVTWAFPYARLAAQRRALYARAYDAALASLNRWGLGHMRVHRQAATIAQSFVDRLAVVGPEEAWRELTAWIERAERTNDLLSMPTNDALGVIREFRDRKFPTLRSKRA